MKRRDGRETYGSPSAIVGAVTFTATSAYPYENLERATLALRGALRHQLLAAGVRGLHPWETFVVEGPVETSDPLGRIWYEYRATVKSSERPLDHHAAGHSG